MKLSCCSNQSQLAPLQLRQPPVDDIRLETTDTNGILGMHHLSGVDLVEHLRLLLRQIRIELRDGRLHSLRFRRLLLRLKARQNRVPLLRLRRLKRVRTELERLLEIRLREVLPLAHVHVRRSLDDRPEEAERAVEVVLVEVGKHGLLLRADLLVRAEHDHQEARVADCNAVRVPLCRVLLRTVSPDARADCRRRTQATRQREMNARGEVRVNEGACVTNNSVARTGVRGSGVAVVRSTLDHLLAVFCWKKLAISKEFQELRGEFQLVMVEFQR